MVGNANQLLLHHCSHEFSVNNIFTVEATMAITFPAEYWTLGFYLVQKLNRTFHCGSEVMKLLFLFVIMRHGNVLPSAAYCCRRLKQNHQSCSSCATANSRGTHLAHGFRYCRSSGIMKCTLPYKMPRILEMSLIFTCRLSRRTCSKTATVSSLVEITGHPIWQLSMMSVRPF